MSDFVKINLAHDEYSHGREMVVSRADGRVTFGIRKVSADGTRRLLICVSCDEAEARKLRKVLAP